VPGRVGRPLRRHPPAATLGGMDTWKFYDITHRDHVVCNPTSVAKLDEIIGLLDLPAAPRMLDIACGKGELLLRLAARYGSGASGGGFRGVGVDISPPFVRKARRRARARVPGRGLRFVLGDGAAYRPPASKRFDIALCLGASWIWGGYVGTLRGLLRLTAPGGRVLVGEPFWIRRPTRANLAVLGERADAFATHEGNQRLARAAGLTVLRVARSSLAEWDGYMRPQWQRARAFAREHPQDPDAAEVLARARHSWQAHQTCERAVLGWGVYLLEKRPPERK